MRNILIFCAATAESLPSSSFELLAAGRALERQLEDANVRAVLIGPDVGKHGEALMQRGADQVLVVSHPRLEHHEGEVMLGAMEMIVQQISPTVILFPHDELSGGHIAPRLAYRLGTGIVTDCTGFDVKDGTIRWIRPVYGGKALAYMAASGPVQLATMRSLAFEPLPADSARQGQVQNLEIDVRPYHHRCAW